MVFNRPDGLGKRETRPGDDQTSIADTLAPTYRIRAIRLAVTDVRTITKY